MAHASYGRASLPHNVVVFLQSTHVSKVSVYLASWAGFSASQPHRFRQSHKTLQPETSGWEQFTIKD